MEATAAIAQARRLQRVRDEHKSKARAERMKLQEAARALDDFIAECSRNGIIITLHESQGETIMTTQPRRHSDTQDTRRAGC